MYHDHFGDPFDYSKQDLELHDTFNISTSTILFFEQITNPSPSVSAECCLVLNNSK